jgi:hypothetical protein
MNPLISSKDEAEAQKRFLERLDNPDKNWKFSWKTMRCARRFRDKRHAEAWRRDDPRDGDGRSAVVCGAS